jgi:hypothetical protein
MTVRLDEDQAAALDAVARADEMHVSEAIRVAIDEHIAARRADAAFQKRIRETMARTREVLERLAQ